MDSAILWVLLMFQSHAGAHSVGSAQFADKAACESAARVADNHGYEAVCVPYSSKQ
jgi:hypothetical protein